MHVGLTSSSIIYYYPIVTSVISSVISSGQIFELFKRISVLLSKRKKSDLSSQLVLKENPRRKELLRCAPPSQPTTIYDDQPAQTTTRSSQSVCVGPSKRSLRLLWRAAVVSFTGSIPSLALLALSVPYSVLLSVCYQQWIVNVM